MEPGSSPPFALGGKEDVQSLMKLSISELISNLRTAFLTSDYDSVEEVLVAKETTLKADVEKKIREIGLLREKIDVETLVRMNVEEEIKKCKDQCEKGRNAEEKYEKLLEAVKKNNLDDKNTIAELKTKISELEDEKRRSECLAESRKRKIEELSERVLRLENDTKTFVNGDTHVGGKAEGLSGIGRNTELESQADPGFSIKVNEGKETIETDVHGRGCENNTPDSAPSQRNSPQSGNTRLSFGEGTGPSPYTSNKDVLGVSDNGHPSLSEAVQQSNLPTGVNDVNGILKRKWVSGNCSCEFGKNNLDGFDTDDTSSSSSSSSASSKFDVDQLPLNSHNNTVDKRRKSEANSLGLNSLQR